MTDLTSIVRSCTHYHRRYIELAAIDAQGCAHDHAGAEHAAVAGENNDLPELVLTCPGRGLLAGEGADLCPKSA